MRLPISSLYRMFLASAMLVSATAAMAQTTLWMQSQPGDYIGQGQTNTYQTPADSFSIQRNQKSGITVAVAGWTLELSAPGGNSALAAGPYEAAARYAFPRTS